MKPKKKSPLKAKPLRNPGQSLDEQRQNLASDKVMEPLMYVAFMIILTGLEWWRYFNPTPPAPILYSVLLVGVILYAAWTIWRVIPTLRQLRLASEGEKAVGKCS